MYILTVHGKENEGAYSVENEDGNHVLYLFQEQDDATRYAMQLNEDEHQIKRMDVIEVDDELALMTCKRYNYKYAVITPNDIVIPPKNANLQKD